MIGTKIDSGYAFQGWQTHWNTTTISPVVTNPYTANSGTHYAEIQAYSEVICSGTIMYKIKS